MSRSGHARDARRAAPLRARLVGLVARGAALTALLSMAAVIGTVWWLQAGRARDESTEVARTLSYALQAAVAFDDRRAIDDTLRILRARPQIGSASVYAADGRLIGRYGGAAAAAIAADGGSLWRGHLTTTEPVVVDGRTLGRVVLVNDLTPLWRSLLIALLAIAGCSLLAFLATVGLARRLAQGIAQPIARLAQASSAIAERADYALRLPDGDASEVGTAIDAFNRMLDEIRARGEALHEANRALEQRVAERTLALQREKERAEAASIAKTRFLANMSHELRTPLNAVLGAAQLLESGGDPAEQAHLLDAIRSGGAHLLAQIENVLDLARIETGALDLAIEDFNLVDCIEAAVATAAVTARMKGLTVACVIDPRLPAWRCGDPMRLRQVLLNVLGNAVKFTLQGEVVLRAEPGATPQALRVQVVDTGIGIPADKLEHVFEPFRQADESAHRRFGGSGLGLAIARQLIESMGGHIAACSRIGRGSCFEVTLALPLAAPHEVPPPLGAPVVYYEPHEASAEALGALLDRLGCEARRCATPDELHAQWHLQAVGGTPPWLLAALEPGTVLEAALDGVDPARVIAMTGTDAAPGARPTHLRGLIKPVLHAALVSRFGSASRAAGTPRPAAGVARPSGAGDGKRILVVEDDATNQTIVCSMLHNAGYRTRIASDGASALALLARDAFDMVLMDWQMPDMDGLEVTRRLRSGAVGRIGQVVPIVALTANAFAEDRSACLAAGMNDFLTKPVLSTALHATVARWTAA